MKKRKILHLAQSAGGVEVYLKHLMKYTNDEVENILICSFDYNVEYWDQICKTYKVDMSREISIKRDVSTVLFVRKIFKMEAPNIVYLHSSKAGAIGRIAAIGLPIKVLYNAHGWAFSMKLSKKKRNLYIVIEKVLSICTRKVVCISEEEKNIAISHGVCKLNKLQVILNGVEVEETKEIIHLKKQTLTVGMVGRLSEQKAPDIFVDMAKIIIDNYNNVKFMLVGDGPLKEEVQSRINALGLKEQIIITGWVENPGDYIEKIDIGVLLSRWEGFGLVLAEYMMHKKPIVATNVGAIPSIIDHDVNGYLVELDSAQKAAEAVMKLIIDKEKCTKFGENGYIKVKKYYTAERLGEEHLKLYAKI